MKKRILTTLIGAAVLAAASCAPGEDAIPEAAPAPQPAALPEEAPAPQPGPGQAASPNAVLEKRIRAAIRQTERRDLLTTHGFWTVFHGILGLGPSVTLLDPATGARVKALDYVADGKRVRGLRFVPTQFGLDVETRPGTFISQGHQDQFVAEMVQWDVPLDRKFRVAGRDYTFGDFVKHSKARASVTANQELEWALLILAEHEGTDAVWTNGAGEQVRLEDLVRRELGRPLNTASCGGTHRLFGLTWAYHLHLQRGGKKEGVWEAVAEGIEEGKKRARRLQNSDGSFSTEWFRGRGNARDPGLRLNTTGHIFEWLALALTDTELHEPWVQEAANALSLMILEAQTGPVEGGSLYHAVHGLLIYSRRMFGAEKLGPLAPPVRLLPGAQNAK
jgi:hypothetical protein